ncbi:MAG: bifunctional diguanylate cyclase/phosphodiesterase, partial [Lysinibacillus sp.]
RNSIFHNEPLYIKTFPTYWDGRVIGAHFIFKNIGELFKEQQPHSYLAYQDELTTLFNRRALNDHWVNIFDKDDETNLALILVDLDRFKKFNESLGKQKADGMLAAVSLRFKRLRSDFVEVYRYNGDEFVFVIRYYSKEEVEDLADQIFNAMKEPVAVEGQDYFITLSVGISAMQANQRLELEEMLHRADQALFFVKKHGRNHYRFYRKEMSQSFPNEALIEAHLRRAIEFDEFSIYFQPQVDLVTGNIESFEALIRWNNRKFGQVPPSQFIPLAESPGIILEIGDWMLEMICSYLQKWKMLGYRKVRIAVNISPRQFKQENFVQKVEALLNKYDVKPCCLELEITEGSMTNVKETTQTLIELKKIGVLISVDDFGTGYSSLSYLKKYPIDILKIDQSFIADIKRDKKNEAIIKAIIAMSKNLGLEVVAEGVEEIYQEQFLLAHQCKKVQGYLYDKPLPVEQMVAQYLA